MYHKNNIFISTLFAVVVVLFTFSSSFGTDIVERDQNLMQLEKSIKKYSISRQQFLYKSFIKRIDAQLITAPEKIKIGNLLYLRNYFTQKMKQGANEDVDILSSESSLILKFTHNGNHKEYIGGFAENIKNIQTVFLFRNKENLSSEEILIITTEIKKYNPNVLIFIDQEGGNINRFIDFPNSRELEDILHHDFIDARLRQVSLEDKEIIEGTFSPERIYYYPSQTSIKKSYDRIIDATSKQYFLEIAAYIRLISLKQVGINTYGIVLDLNYGNPIISGYERSFSASIEDYKKLIDAYNLASQMTGVVLYGKHFPGHGAGKIDSHKGVLDISGYNTYTKNNLEVFQYFLAQKISIPKGIMVGHMYVLNEHLIIFGRMLDRADFILTDDLSMQGYVLSTGEDIPGKFFTTDQIFNRSNLIKIDMSSPGFIE